MPYLLYAKALDFKTHNHEEQLFGVFDSIGLAQQAIDPITPQLKLEPAEKREGVYRAFGLPNENYDILEWWAYPFAMNTLIENVEDWRK